MSKRPCSQCGLRRQEKFFTSERGRVCVTCQKKNRRKTQRVGHIARTYGLSVEDHDRLAEYQGGACAICKGTRPYSLAVDHDHRTGKVRGLLCKRDNKILALVGDNIRLLRAMADYLSCPPAVQLDIEAKAPQGGE